MRRDRPVMPEGYGVPEGEEGGLEWVVVEDRLTSADVYWMATTRSDGRPHVVPRWGVWLDDRLWYDGSPETVHARNLQDNSNCVLHLEDGSQAVIVEGRSRPSHSPGRELGSRLSSAFSAKYSTRGYSPEADAWEGPDAGGLLVFEPRKAIAWFSYPEDATRFRFEVT